ncbi:MAG: hypothetical protein EOP48_24720 [Sphingobacteriales bacterium]|nr:MAG: hypothetical protein EOP48_24720 [Sphingobacteriales bacterium]
MKRYLFLSAVLWLLLACESSKSDEIRTFIPGTYARFSDHEMRKEYDTLRINVISETGNNYSLIRSSSFQRKMDGKEFAWEFTKEEWTAVYDENKRVLNETRKGKVLSFVPQRNTLLVGTTEYKKVN